ncbi:hypothetical protein [Marivita geojedonensis]|uniref:Uncharacterized protein n=1 Tax=Marivita geojedonensis TaxID=1123756 RepID=A0A1X4NNS6_9RHOB|nr:hypothetical protein [Marivita geojedonensis]OSQ52113.1 hypothetical protein MGEO_06240 [Marivita geojedonensis]PRY81110.1 hypothetical protein CLV76_10267 [Marivita geojedonensis]
MIGKHKTRAASFTLVHAGVLIAALGLAPILSAELDNIRKAAGVELSELSYQEQPEPRIIRASFKAFWSCDETEVDDVDV